MKAKLSDYKNKKINSLTILDLFSNEKGHTIARCLCSCGKICDKKLAMIKINHTTSCGCVGISNRFTKNSKIILINDFSQINKDSAYWLGFIFGDGNIDDKNKFQMCLGLKSKNHLIKLSNFLVGKDITKTYQNRCQLQITSEILANNMAKFGIIPRKTYNSNLILPKNKTLKKHFIRGYIDADGWITTTEQNIRDKIYIRHSIGLCSYLKENLELISKELPVTFKEPNKIKGKNLYDLRYQKKEEIIKILEYLYSPGNINLEYKWNKIRHLLKY